MNYDTLGVSVKGDVRYSAFEGPNGQAAVLWNSGDQPEKCKVSFDSRKLKNGIFCKPFAGQETVKLPYRFELPPQTAAVLVATQQ